MRILLAGTHRSGATWVANVLGRATAVHCVYEPDCELTDILGTVSSHRLGEYPALRPSDKPRWYPMVWDLAFAGGWPWARSQAARNLGRGLVKVPSGVRDYTVAVLAEVVTRLRPRPEHVLVQSANCALSLEWVAERYNPVVVVLRRNPLNIISSWVALNHSTHPSLAYDPVVRERWLQPLGLPVLPKSASQVARTAWTVGLLSVALRVAADRHPDWIVASHDELSNEPGKGFAALYERLGLTWTEATAAYLSASEDPEFVVHHDNPRTAPNAITSTLPGVSRREQQDSQYRRRLSEGQIDEARAVLSEFPLGEWGATAEREAESLSALGAPIEARWDRAAND